MASRKTLALLIIAALSLVVLTGCQTKVITTGGTGAANTVTSSGTGTASATPDQATMTFGVTAQSKDAKDALDTASATATKITDAIAAAGVDKKDIQTQNVSVYPITDPGSNQITSYQANLSVTAKVRDLADLSKVISAATGAGADSISGPTFGVADDTPYREDAIDKAVQDARVNAEAMAKAAGKSVGEVVSITANDAAIGPLPYAAAQVNAKDAAAGVPIEPGQLDVMANVTVIFELK